MSVAYELDRCTATSWRGTGNALPWNRCIRSHHTPHDVHRDGAGNNFIIDDKGVAHVVDVHGRRLN